MSRKRCKIRKSAVAVFLTLLLIIAGFGVYFAGRLIEKSTYPPKYREHVEKYAAENGLEPELVFAVIKTESSFRPGVVSSAGAIGRMQLMPDTAEWIARKLKTEGWSFDRMNDPESNIRFGCWYLNYLSVMFLGDPVCVICAYHAGQGKVASWL